MIGNGVYIFSIPACFSPRSLFVFFFNSHFFYSIPLIFFGLFSLFFRHHALSFLSQSSLTNMVLLILVMGPNHFSLVVYPWFLIISLHIILLMSFFGCVCFFCFHVSCKKLDKVGIIYLFLDCNTPFSKNGSIQEIVPQLCLYLSFHYLLLRLNIYIS